MHEHSPHHGHHDHGWQPAGRRPRSLEPFLLLFIARGVPHGYGLIARLNAADLAPVGIDVGTLYRSLHELELAGFVESSWVDPPEGQRRREYTLTPLGRERLTGWAEVMTERGRLVRTFLDEFRAVASEELEPAVALEEKR